MTRRRVAVAALVVVVVVVASVLVPRLVGRHPSASAGCTRPVLTTSVARTWRDGPFVVDQDLWNNHGGTQTLRVCSYRSWSVTATQPDTEESPDVNSYPDVWRAYRRTVDSFSRIDSSFVTRGPRSGAYDFTYDVWIDGVADEHSTEVMVWTRNHGNRVNVPRRGTFTADGIEYDVYRAGRFIAFIGPPRDRGRLDLLAFFRYAVTRGWLTGSSVIRRIEFGVEVSKTGDRPLDFAVDDYSLTTAPARRPSTDRG